MNEYLIAFHFKTAHVCSEYMISSGCIIKEGGLFQEQPYSYTVLVIHHSKQTRRQGNINNP